MDAAITKAQDHPVQDIDTYTDTRDYLSHARRDAERKGYDDWLIVDIPNRVPEAVVLQSVFGFLYGLTFSEYVLLFWPLAYINQWLLGRISPSDTHSHAASR